MGKLYCGKYKGIGRVEKSGYEHSKEAPPGFYEPDNPQGFKTGQWITVKVIAGVMCDASWREYHKGGVVKGVWSYGGDTCIIGKPQIGDIVGNYFEPYSKNWEKLTPKQIKKLRRQNILDE